MPPCHTDNKVTDEHDDLKLPREYSASDIKTQIRGVFSRLAARQCGTLIFNVKVDLVRAGKTSDLCIKLA